MFASRPKCAPNVEHQIAKLEAIQTSLVELLSSKTTDEAARDRKLILEDLKDFFNNHFADTQYDKKGNFLSPGEPKLLEEQSAISCPYNWGRKYTSIDGSFQFLGVEVNKVNVIIFSIPVIGWH